MNKYNLSTSVRHYFINNENICWTCINQNARI
nr:MAG TPA: outer capsid protein sigma-1 attachment protein [Bacteriophage sp.]